MTTLAPPRKYLGEFSCREDVARAFDAVLDDNTFPTDEEIVVAVYEYGNYEGSAFALFQRDGRLYEVHGGHCSCYGLEDQWEPEETTAEALRDRLEKGRGGLANDKRVEALIRAFLDPR
jgi:hypothetical protein